MNSLCSLGPGDYFGELSLYSNSKCYATAVAVSGSLIISIPKSLFRAVFMERRTILAEIKLKLLKPDEPIPLILVLQHMTGFRQLLVFLKKELAQENVLFWKEVDAIEQYIEYKARNIKNYFNLSNLDDYNHEMDLGREIPMMDLHRPMEVIAEMMYRLVEKFIATDSPLQVCPY